MSFYGVIAKEENEDNPLIDLKNKEEYNRGWNAALAAFEEEFLSISHLCFNKYKEDKENYPKPNFISAVALAVSVRDKLEKKGED